MTVFPSSDTTVIAIVDILEDCVLCNINYIIHEKRIEIISIRVNRQMILFLFFFVSVFSEFCPIPVVVVMIMK